MRKKLHINLSRKIKSYWIDGGEYFSMKSFDKFRRYFFDFDFFELYNSAENRDGIDGTVYDIQDTEIPKSRYNIMLCVENCPANWWYKHYNEYGDYGDQNISIYFYGHKDKIEETTNFIAIPIIYLQLNYFKNNFEQIKPDIFTHSQDKKFCIVASRLDTDRKREIYKMLNEIGECHHISEFKNLIGYTSSYHSTELLNLFNQFKFVFVCENGISDGYITEKIFNCFFSRSVPIYYGSDTVETYFNPSTFINVTRSPIEELKPKITEISNNEVTHNTLEIVNQYSDENYKTRLEDFINKNS
jgi:hypothetical protein